MNFDVDRARQDTPGCQNVLHFNNARASLMPLPVLEAVTDYLRQEATIGPYEAAEQNTARVEQVYGAVAELLNCGPDEIAFTENATRAWIMAFYSQNFQPGDRILTAQAEYASNYIGMLHLASKTGAIVEVIPDDETGQLSLTALQNMLDERVKLIAITHIPSNNGLINPVAEVGQIAKAAGITYLLDSCQAAGQMPLDVDAIGCDMLSATGRKYLRGPRGTGFLYVRRDLIEQLEPPFLEMRSATWTSPTDYEIVPDAHRFETWEASYAGKIGLGVAVDYALSWGLENIQARIAYLADCLRQALADVPGVILHDQGHNHAGLVSFELKGHDPDAVRLSLNKQRINTSVVPLTPLNYALKQDGLTALLRASLHYYNTEDEIRRFCQTLEQFL